MTTDLDQLLLNTTTGAATSQRVGWEYTAWRQTLQHAPRWRKVGSVLEDLEDRWAQDGGISRTAVVDIATDDFLRLLVTSMFWGFRTLPYGPARLHTMLSTLHLTSELKRIAFNATAGAPFGFAALFRHRKPVIKGLGVAMGSKYLYFAAGGLERPKGGPLVYDDNVYRGLRNLTGGLRTAPNPKGYVAAVSYASVVEFIETSASTFDLTADDAEYALYGSRTWLRREDRLTRIARYRQLP